MNRLVYLTAAATMLGFVVCTPALAQQDQQQQQQQQNARKALDPNQIVCEKQQDTGSRLASKRICMTRSQWAEQRRLDRQDVEKAQMQAPMNVPQ